MKYCLLPALLFAAAQISAQYQIQPIPFQQVELRDAFWQPRIETVRNTTLPHTLNQCEATGRFKNFEVAGGQQTGGFCSPYPFDDSDVYKAIEGAAYLLQTKPDPALQARINTLIGKIAAAQEPDGYLYTWRTIAEKQKAAGTWSEKDAAGTGARMATAERWVNEDQHSHELYNAGHLYEAAVAWFQATGNRNLLDVALKNADLVDKTFGPGKLKKAPGHQEIEIGLVKLYQQTGERRYLNLAKFFLDARGYGESYMQNHQSLALQREAVGHAVRAGYMFAAAADVTALTADTSYMPALRSVWNDIVSRKMYITGGVGSTGSNEGFSAPYELPNFSAYCETCSSIAFVLWNQRMFQLTGDSRYIDVMERTLYNALNAGLSLSGDHFFYPNPLESRGNVARSEWFSCACCPPNIVRFYASLPGLFYAKSGNTLFVNLFAAGKTKIQNINSVGQTVNVVIRQETEYPWNGKVLFRIDPEKPNTFTLKLRIPGWAKGDAVPFDLYRFADWQKNNIVVKVNSQTVTPVVVNGYATIERKWQAGDVVEYSIPMPVRRIGANAQLSAAAHRNALQRGPVVFCVEGKDQPDPRVLNMVFPDSFPATERFDAALFGGVSTLSLEGYLVNSKTATSPAAMQKMSLRAIPYYTWANRGKDNMLVWLPYELQGTRATSAPTLASKSKISASDGVKGAPAAVADQYIAEHSNDQSNPFVHWWPHFGTTEWVQYDFPGEEQVGTARVFWFDDESTGGGCRIPDSWRLLYLENGEWKPVYAPAGYPVSKDGWNEVQFEPVKTTAIRLELRLKQGVSGGIHEWEIK